jgi:recombination protein RecR
MSKLPAVIESAIHDLSRLPGIGRRGAERIVTHLLEARAEQTHALSEALLRLRERIRPCRRCGNWTEADLCPICEDPSRESGRLCVVERPTDVYAFEQSGAFHGRYHVLGGTLSPLHGVSPEDLTIEALTRRVQAEGIGEIIVATSPTVEGDATALYLARVLRPHGVQVERIGLGLPLGASLGYADAGTLKLAFEGRRRLES